MKFGSVALIGKSNVGKSTFINQVLKIKLSITSPVVQTPRNTILGIYNDDDSQIVFYDTPGIYKTMNRMNREMMKETKRSLDNVDLILYFINSYDRINSTDKGIMKVIKESETPCFLIINKSDLIQDEEEFFSRLEEFKNELNFEGRFAISALYNHNVDSLIEDIKNVLEDGTRIYDEDLFTDRPVRFLVSEYIREKAINLTREDVPHSLTCIIDDYKEKDNGIVSISASIVCEKESQKPILIGKNGSMIKEIGTQARKDIEALLGTKCYLELFVKVEKGWREKEYLLKEYGLLSKKDEE